MDMSFKVAFIGAGHVSCVCTHIIYGHYVGVPEFRDIEVAFTDINATNLERTRALCQAGSGCEWDSGDDRGDYRSQKGI